MIREQNLNKMVFEVFFSKKKAFKHYFVQNPFINNQTYKKQLIHFHYSIKGRL